MSFLPEERASELKELFFESAQELLQALNEEGLELEKRPGDREIVRSVRRTVHTLKGDSAACGYKELSELAHALEDVLTPEVASATNGRVAEVVLAAADTFHDMLAAYRSNSQPPVPTALRAQILGLVGGTSVPEQKPATEFKPAFQWTEYQQLVITDAQRQGEAIYHVALAIDPGCPMRAAALQLVSNVLQESGTILAMLPENASAAVDVIEAAIASDHDAAWIEGRCRIPAVISQIKVERAAGAAVSAGAAAQEVDVFNDVANALSSAMKLDDVLHVVMEKVAQYFHPNTWSLLLVDEQKDELYFAIVTGPAAESLKKVRLKMGEGIAGWVAQHGEPVISPDVYSDPRFAKRIDDMVKFQTRSMVCTALRAKGRVLGVIQLINCPVEKMGDKEMSFLQSLCDYAGMAIENARALESREVKGVEETAAQLAAANILRVDAERIDTVLNLVGELIIGKSMLHQILGDFDKRFAKDPLRGKFADAMALQARVLNDLQKSVMKIRMVPVEQLFRRFPRLVRDVAKLRKKEVALKISGEDTDLDKSILDALAEPLTHLVRNAVDHGIELPQERLAAGKPAQGTISLNAYHQGNQIIIEISDDGRGIDRDKVVRKAIERGLVAAADADQLSEQDALNLIFHSGLSTAQEITEVSGRGVGMDVVQSVLERLKGSVFIQTRPGQGTTFLLKVPLTLAIINALLFRVGEKIYAVPLNSVVEITRAAEAAVHRVDQHEVLQLREEVLTLVRLHKLAGVSSRAKGDKLFVVVVALAEKKFGLIVDSLVGEEELVIKAIDDHLVATDLVSGASILGDGTVVLILNIQAVVQRMGRTAAAGGAA